MSWNPNNSGGYFPGLMPVESYSQMNGPSGMNGLPGVSSSSKYGWSDLDFGQKFNMGMQGITGIGNLWGAWQSNKLAKDQLNFTKKFANMNLANQMKSYNTALEDRSRSRAAAEGQTSAEAAAYVDRNRMTGK